jgi:hypothetical protein
LDAGPDACDDGRVRRALFFVLALMAATSVGTPMAASAVTVPAASTAWSGAPDPTGGGYDLERPPSECIGLLQRPDCGREPIDSGDRGGALQWATFALILGGQLAFIFTVVFRNVIRADRAKAAQVAEEDRARQEANETST